MRLAGKITSDAKALLWLAEWIEPKEGKDV